MLYLEPHRRQHETFFHSGQIDPQQISLYQDRLLVIDCSKEHCGDQAWLLQMYDTLAAAHPDFYILSHHPGDHGLTPQLWHWPYWYLHSRVILSKVEIDRPRSRLIGCLNGNPRTHRIAHFYALKKRFSEQQMHVSMFQTSFEPVGDPVHLHEEEKQYYESVKNLLPVRQNIVSNSVQLPALTDAYLHIISETTVRDRIFLTEKTWKPIVAGQIFLMFGNPGSVAYLRSVGVDCFDDIIDHDRYDHLPDWRDRMHEIHNIIADLQHENWAQIYQSTHTRRLNNQTRFFSGDFQHIYHNYRIESLLKPHVSCS